MFFSTQISAEIYSWKDEYGVTHFSETKPNKPINNIKTLSVKKDPESEVVSEKATERAQPKKKFTDNKLSEAFLAGIGLVTVRSPRKNNNGSLRMMVSFLSNKYLMKNLI
jgi:hypothetical protein